MRHCVTSTSVGIAPQHLTDLERVQWVNLGRAESCSARPPCSSEHRESNVRQWHFQRCGAHIKAPKTNRATRRTTHRMLWYCRPHTRVPPASVRDIKQTQKHNAATTATVAIHARRSPQLPTCTQRAQSKQLRVHWMRRSTVSSDAPAARNMPLTSVLGANWLARTNQRWCHPLGKNTGAFPTSSAFRWCAAASENTCNSLRACSYQTINLDNTIETNKTVNLTVAKKQQHTDNDDILIKFANMSPANRKASSLYDSVATTVHVTSSMR